MNALNLLSARLIRPAPTNGPSSLPPRSPAPRGLDETTSWVSKQQRSNITNEDGKDDDEGTDAGVERDDGQQAEDHAEALAGKKNHEWPTPDAEVEIPIEGGEKDGEGKATPVEITKSTGRDAIRWRLAEAFVASIRWIFSTIAAPGRYLIACMSDDRGRFAPLLPIRKTGRIVMRLWRARSTSQAVGLSATSDEDTTRWGPTREKRMQPTRLKSYQAQDSQLEQSSTVAATRASVGAQEMTSTRIRVQEQNGTPEDGQSRITSSGSSDESIAGRRYIRIKASKEDAHKRRSSRKTDSAGSRGSDGAGAGGWLEPPLTPATLKSPTSPASSTGMAKYPRAPVPPRPLIPRRRPSNQLSNPNAFDPALKTLILDLDETLIHSLAKGGRMSTGHMVEVKLNTTIGLGNGGAVLGPQHPILYYVHKRPHCDDFLRKVRTVM